MLFLLLILLYAQCCWLVFQGCVYWH